MGSPPAACPELRPSVLRAGALGAWLALLASTPALAQEREEGFSSDGVGGLLPVSGSIRWQLDEEGRGVWDTTRADARAPIMVRGEEVLEAGEWLFQLRAHRTHGDDLRDGRDDLRPSEVLADFWTIVPTELTSWGLDLELFHALDNEYTVYGRLPWLSKEMGLRTEAGERFETEARGIGDLELGVLRNWYEDEGALFVAGLGLSLPTGSTDEEDGNAAGEDELLPYTMQLGSGTFDLHPSLVYMRQYERWSWGAAGRWRIHLGENDEGWSRGDEGRLGAWVARRLGETVSASLRVEGSYWGDVHGEADELDRTENPANEPHRQGGERVDLAGGLQWRLGDTYERVNLLGLELGVPVAEWLDGPQVGTDYWIGLGWRISF